MRYNNVKGGVSVSRLYIDTSVLNRPFDDQTQARIKLETEAFLAILERVEKGVFGLANSSVLVYENEANPYSDRQERIESYLKLADHFVDVEPPTRERARQIEEFGVQAIDALHLAAAEQGADYFLTVDDHLLKKSRKFAEELRVKVADPIDFVLSEEFTNA